ncbi:hypothetical protein B0H13DRAFT_1866622 [Mycena leptocephala]|nr:hypothetical protein B0H13DRAFT_1866622 [Mycena leptocephala]
MNKKKRVLMVMSPWLGRDFRQLWKLDSPGGRQVELQLNSEPVNVLQNKVEPVLPSQHDLILGRGSSATQPSLAIFCSGYSGGQMWAMTGLREPEEKLDWNERNFAHLWSKRTLNSRKSRKGKGKRTRGEEGRNETTCLRARVASSSWMESGSGVEAAAGEASKSAACVSVQVRVRVVVLPDIRVPVNVGSAWVWLGSAQLRDAEPRRGTGKRRTGRRTGDAGGWGEDGVRMRGSGGTKQEKEGNGRTAVGPVPRVRLDEFEFVRKSMTVAKHRWCMVHPPTE